MNIQELNIGNWVSWNNEPCKVVGINPPYLDVVDSRNNPTYSVHIDDVTKIEINSNMLTQNGFSQVFIDNTYYHRYEKENLDITCSQHKSDYKCRITINTKYERLCWVYIQYIHQLQNACNLVGKELEIKL